MTHSEPTWTIADLGAEVAHTDRYAGGGAVAGMSLVGAAAAAELVFRLSLRRRGLPDADQKRLEQAVQLCERLRGVFQAAIDEDIASLNELLDAQGQFRRERKSAGSVCRETSERLHHAVASAIETPLRVARDATRLMRTIADLQHLARPFTASDLGAAAATAHGAVTSLLMMAEANLAMVDGEEDVTRIANELEELYAQCQDRAREVIAYTRSVIR